MKAAGNTQVGLRAARFKGNVILSESEGSYTLRMITTIRCFVPQHDNPGLSSLL